MKRFSNSTIILLPVLEERTMKSFSNSTIILFPVLQFFKQHNHSSSLLGGEDNEEAFL